MVVFDGVYCRLIFFRCGWRGLFHRRVNELGNWWISHFGIRRLVDYWRISGENSLGGSVTIESGVGTEADRFRCG
jgi:hypothetical protein